MAPQPSRQNVETYLIPILLSIALIAISFLVGGIDKSSLLASAGLVALLVAGSFLAQLMATRQLARRERSALFDTLSALAFSQKDLRTASGILSETEVLAIESCAREVWIYAYDLQWENSDSPFTKMVKQNLARGISYRYLVPRDDSVVSRVQQLQRTYALIPSGDALTAFRASDRERTINQFGCTIYNPTFLQDRPQDDVDTESVAVFFPHYANFSTEGAEGQALFLAVRGSATVSIQEAFANTWAKAEDLKR